MFQLKDYQARALDALDDFFRRLRQKPRDEAWLESLERTGQDSRPYDDSALGDVPAVCVRIPTGGGKTYLAAHAVPRIAKLYCDSDAPVALWLVPSDAIRTQTLEALKTARHPCRMALESYFGDRVRVCGLEDLATVGRHEFGTSAVIIVATIQSFNVSDRSKRNVYSFDESLAPHFQGITQQKAAALDTVQEEDLEAQPYLTRSDLGRVKTSLANLLALVRPIVVVDEAHNNRTAQAFRTLQRLNPACVVELTATPAANSNVVFHVGAMALQREEMIKLPIVLVEHPTGWRAAIRDAILTRNRLEQLTVKESDYVRPVLLIQAQPKGGEATVDEVLAYLIADDGEKLEREQIAVATGSQKELDGIVIADRACPIRYVITVEALKEGWDCPFAYVLCSLQDAHSAKDVEQLLGRVLRMPYARSRSVSELNQAYAHIVARSFSEVATLLKDRLFENMGFEAYEVDAALTPPSEQAQLPLGTTPSRETTDAYVPLPSIPPMDIPDAMRDTVEIIETMSGAAAVIRGEVTDEVEAFLLEGFRGKQKERVRLGLERERQRQQHARSPAARNIPFAPLPLLCIDFDGDIQPVDAQLLSLMGEFDLLAIAPTLDGFAVRESGSVFEIDVEGGKVTYGFTDHSQLQFDTVTSTWTERDLVRWLDRECRQPDIAQPSLVKWLLKLVEHLRVDRGMSLTALVRARHQLKEATLREIARRRLLAASRAFQTAIPQFLASPRQEDAFRYEFQFRAGDYPAQLNKRYRGSYKFKKHYHGIIHDLREKTDAGQISEEFRCAVAIDTHPAVKHWIRNVEREKLASFWLPTATDLFYPDFVCELNDGRLLVVEYKGEPYVTNDDSKEKAQIGEQWEKSSGGRCLFLMATNEDNRGRDVARQIADKIEGA